MVRAGCVFVAGIHPSRTWTSGSFESVRWNACVHRLDLGLYSHSKEFFGEWSLNPCWLQGKNPLYRKISPEEDRTRDAVDSEPKHYQRAIPDPCQFNCWNTIYKTMCLCLLSFRPCCITLCLPLLVCISLTVLLVMEKKTKMKKMKRLLVRNIKWIWPKMIVLNLKVKKKKKKKKK